MAPILMGVDTGGTFTDLIMVNGTRIESFKTPSTPDDLSGAVLTGIQTLCERLPNSKSARFTLVHSSTVATNAVLERKGAKVGLITTQGFRDIIELGRQHRDELYNFLVDRPFPLVSRSRRLEIHERVDARGRILVRPSRDEIEAVLDRFERAGVESIAICLLFSFLRPGHEQTVATAAMRRGFSVSASSKILPEIREYERSSTTVVNAFVSPVINAYINRLQRAVRKIGARQVRIVQSNGGSLSVRAAASQPVRTLLSGPAAGLHGALDMYCQCCRDVPRLITFDMGGTSTDVSLVDGKPTLSTERDVAGYPIGVPMLDIHTVGAGGGSIARVDSGGALQIGPDSAGAMPGPACYGHGSLPTVTDANLMLGRISPKHFLSGRLPLSLERTEDSLSGLARKMQTDNEEAARGIIRIVNANMERAIRLISIERGFDPREFTLVCFGGAGGLHACELAQALHISRIMIPAHPGVLSAWGAVASDLIKDYSRSVMKPLVERSLPEIDRTIERLRRKAMAEMAREDAAPKSIQIEISIDVRYVGQSYELTIPYSGRLDHALQAFHRLHEKRYGYCQHDAAEEVVTVRLRGRFPLPGPTLSKRPNYSKKKPIIGDGKIFERKHAAPGTRLKGPALIAEDFSTTYVATDWLVRFDEYGHMWLTC